MFFSCLSGVMTAKNSGISYIKLINYILITYINCIIGIIENCEK